MTEYQKLEQAAREILRLAKEGKAKGEDSPEEAALMMASRTMAVVMATAVLDLLERVEKAEARAEVGGG